MSAYSYEYYPAQEDYPPLFPQFFDQSFYELLSSSMEFLPPPLPPPPKDPLYPLEHDLTFSSDGATVMTETQVFPMPHFIEQLRKDCNYHWENGNTATCWFWIKGTQDGFWAHRAYLATQSKHFRTIFERFTDNPIEDLELDVLHPDVFWGVLRYLYDGDVEAWLEEWFTSQEMVRKIQEVVEYLEIVQVPEKVSYRVRLELKAVRLT
ncbi:hypothetical protein BC937DRAFT_92834 [Endogone sp. FLAS-F59071]|nr:hypothetical protein BC937DRAFT_92834 [Endogone sp. FLAS-F59071]|eukprot:RUS15154.1 hypothetical protein BC937DRAFT_92834 [Endogone sp. FLAS-F59071]